MAQKKTLEVVRPMYEMNAKNLIETSVFRKIDGTIIENISQYIKDYFVEKRNNGEDSFEIFIGTDSQRVRRGRLTLYATVICLYILGKGAHVIYASTKRNDIQPATRKRKLYGGNKRPADGGLFYRLQWEVEYSMQVANYLNENKVFVDCGIAQVHLDISANSENDSNIAYTYAMGYVRQAGYNARAKPNAIAASYCADMAVRRQG